MNSTASPRTIKFDGAKNVRDFGGIAVAGGGTTRFGVLFRADGLSRLSDADLERLAALRLRTVIDLRYDEERQRAPDRLPPCDPPQLYCRGFLPNGTLEMFKGVNSLGADATAASELMRRNYARMPFDHASELSDVMHYLVRADAAPLLIHCTSGKDRTGLLAAFILRAIGVDAQAVLSDYELSNCEHQAVDVFGPAARPEAVAVVMSARAEFLAAAFEAIEQQCGDFETYLNGELSFGAVECARLRELLVA